MLGAASQVIDLTPCFGTEIHGLQLNALTDAQKDELALLTAQRGVVVFRDQQIDIEEQLQLGRYFGRLHIHPTSGHPKDYPEVHLVYQDGKSIPEYHRRPQKDQWHSDVTYELQPPGLTTLKIVTKPPTGGDTLWANQYALYDKLSPNFKEILRGLQAVHSAVGQAEESRKRGGPVRREPVQSVHPVVRTHPVTGWPALFVNP